MLARLTGLSRVENMTCTNDLQAQLPNAAIDVFQTVAVNKFSGMQKTIPGKPLIRLMQPNCFM